MSTAGRWSRATAETSRKFSNALEKLRSGRRSALPLNTWEARASGIAEAGNRSCSLYARGSKPVMLVFWTSEGARSNSKHPTREPMHGLGG